MSKPLLDSCRRKPAATPVSPPCENCTTHADNARNILAKLLPAARAVAEPRTMPERKLTMATLWRQESTSVGHNLTNVGPNQVAKSGQHWPDLDPNWSKLGPTLSMLTAGARKLLHNCPRELFSSIVRAYFRLPCHGPHNCSNFPCSRRPPRVVATLFEHCRWGGGRLVFGDITLDRFYSTIRQSCKIRCGEFDVVWSKIAYLVRHRMGSPPSTAPLTAPLHDLRFVNR